MEFQFKRYRIDKISEEHILAELDRAAVHFEYVVFTKRDFDGFAKISANTAVRAFGSWTKAMSALRGKLKEKNVELRPRRKGYFTDEELFDEMGRIWKELGHRPSRIEWENSNPRPRISYPTYRRYFGGWENACLRFLEHKMGSQISVKEFSDERVEERSTDKARSRRIRKRDVPLKIRLAVLKRDSFRCVFCGRSPAIHPGVVLHIDHKVPFSKSGDTTIKNLQTLCDKCNLGKGDTHIV